MNFHALISKMQRTGQPVSASIPLSTDGVSRETIDVTPSRTHKVVLNDPAWYRKDTPVPYHNTIIELLARRRKLKMPDSFCSKAHADLYVGLVDFSLLNLVPDEKLVAITKAIGGSDRDVWHWQHPQQGESYLLWAAKMLNSATYVTALALGDFLGMKPEWCFHRFTKSEKPMIFVGHLGRYPNQYPSSITHGSNTFGLVTTDAIKDYCGKTIQYALRYSYGTELITAFAKLMPMDQWDDVYRIGFSQVDAILPSLGLISTNLSATILLSLDPQVTFRLRQMAREVDLLSKAGVIVTGLYGGQTEVDALDWTPLAFRNVMVLACPVQGCLGLVDPVVKRLKEVHAESIRVWPWPLITQAQILRLHDLPENARGTMTANIINLDAVEVFSTLTHRITDDAMPLAEFREWRVTMSLNPSENKPAANKAAITLPVKNYEELPEKPARNLGAPVKLDEIFNAKNTTLMYGPSNTGKSYFAIQLATALALGKDFFFLKKATPCRVMYIDGEIGDEMRSRIDQLLQDDPPDPDMLCKNLRTISERGLKITQTTVQEQLMLVLDEEKPQVVILDNVFSLANEAAKGSANKLFEIVHKIEARGIGVIILHHTTKQETTYKGPYELESLVQNLIEFQNRDSIMYSLSDKSVLVPDHVRFALQKPGPVMRMVYKKCKVAAEFEGLTKYFVLPVNGVWSMFEPRLTCLPCTEQPEQTLELISYDQPEEASDYDIYGSPAPETKANLMLEVSEEKVDSIAEDVSFSGTGMPAETQLTKSSETSESPLPPDAQIIVKAFTSKGSFTRGEVDKLLGSDDSSKKRNARSLPALNYLIARNIVVRCGVGRNTYYYISKL